MPAEQINKYLQAHGLWLQKLPFSSFFPTLSGSNRVVNKVILQSILLVSKQPSIEKTQLTDSEILSLKLDMSMGRGIVQVGT